MSAAPDAGTDAQPVLPSLGDLIYLFMPQSDGLDTLASAIVHDLPPLLEKAAPALSQIRANCQRDGYPCDRGVQGRFEMHSGQRRIRRMLGERFFTGLSAVRPGVRGESLGHDIRLMVEITGILDKCACVEAIAQIRAQRNVRLEAAATDAV